MQRSPSMGSISSNGSGAGGESRLRRMQGNAVKAVQRRRRGPAILFTEDVEALWPSYRFAAALQWTG
jgi:hypothetical protein